MVQGITSVIIKTGNVKKLAAFYTDALGVPVHHDCPECVVLELGPGQWLVVHTDNKHDDVAIGEAPKAGRCGFGLKVADVDAAYKKLKGKVNFPMPPADEEWGARTVTGFDPEGNKISFVEERQKGARGSAAARSRQKVGA